MQIMPQVLCREIIRICKKQTELETFSGYIVKEAKRLGVEIPLSEKMYQGLREMAEKF